MWLYLSSLGEAVKHLIVNLSLNFNICDMDSIYAIKNS